MFATASPSRKRSFETHCRRSCNSACMTPMMAGPPYEVAPSLKSDAAISFLFPAIVLGVVPAMTTSWAERGSVVRASILGPRAPNPDVPVREPAGSAARPRHQDGRLARRAAGRSETGLLLPPRSRPRYDRQAQPHSPGLPRAGTIDAGEPLEDPLTVHRLDSGARIVHLYHALARRRKLHHHADRSPARRIFDRVVQHIDEALAKNRRVAHRLDVRRGLDLQALTLLLSEDVQAVRHVRRQLTQIDDIAAHYDPTRFPACECQQVLHQTGEPVDLLEHAPDDLPVFRRTRRPLQCYLSHAPHRG